MIPLSQITDFLEEWAPLETAADWDNVGLQIGHKDTLVHSVLLSIDVDSAVLNTLSRHPSNLVITHHPLFFKPLKRIQTASDIGKILKTFLLKGIQLYSMHTNLDAAVDGVNDCLVRHYGFDPSGQDTVAGAFGKIITGPNLSFFELKKRLPCQILGNKAPKSIQKLAFCCGSGHGLLQQCFEKEVDCIITGEISYHDEVFCEMNGITVIALGHKESELFILDKIKEKLESQFPTLRITLSTGQALYKHH